PTSCGNSEAAAPRSSSAGRGGAVASILELYGIVPAPFPERLLLGLVLEIMPPIDGVPAREQAPEIGVGTAPIEVTSNLVDVVRQELAHEPHHQRLAQIEVSLVREPYVLLLVLDVVRQLLVVADDVRMHVDLSCRDAEVAFLLAYALKAGEQKGMIE